VKYTEAQAAAMIARTAPKLNEDEKLEPIDTDILVGWFCCAVITVAWCSFIFWVVRFSWDHRAAVRALFGF
jgi:hypothetical protein